MSRFARRSHRSALVASSAVLAMATLAWAGPDEDEDIEFDFAPAAVEGALMMPNAAVSAEMGATPGGAQDISFARERIAAGEVPHPNTFTPEGLFSEHDLPLPASAPCRQTLCLTGAATPADLLVQPEVRVLAQLGFSSGLDPRSWKRAPLNLVAVVDKSGSMSGHPLDTVKASLHTLIDQLGPADQLSVVLYGDRAHVHLQPTPIEDRAALHRAIDGIQSRGSTAMEAGLTVGYATARASGERFDGTTRVMLFTDERPNVGATHAESFMGMARAASADGIGLTTIGVSTHFGAELATTISSVRGGNLYFFPDPATMKETFADELDTMVTELAYGLELDIAPGQGWEIAGLYGVPGDLVERTPEGGLRLMIETIFLSKRKGAIYIALAPASAMPPSGGAPAVATVRYLDRAGKSWQDTVAFNPTEQGVPLGLARGRLLVDQATALKKAAALHLTDNDQEGAWRLVRALLQRFDAARVPGLEGERQTIADLDRTLTRLSGHQGEARPVATRDPVTGLPR